MEKTNIWNDSCLKEYNFLQIHNDIDLIIVKYI